ncbi:MAG: NADPH:quinone reductase [Rhodospirillaceae bacterium]|jgi:NADPH2:quinone reductase|nr:NADPH:quinone reductase [Rhodospirillaceae bacterium]MBT3810178.1 NADPH:quinone reductase [Rhodospirillaceae bacterium]MBT4771637.1 NADPH:quinone reductase [Rhodospirillaceae bacterium]MBT5358221.1 NADPH:quinone reductase [Rhodospirillaceae bacterium]MBT5768006.1 NADPH:quinone reductase [Rhodospirillaceae bacterium]
MRAAWYEEQGPARDVIRSGEMPTPEPGPGEVRVKLSHSGVNPSDTKRRTGFGGQPHAFPQIVPHSDGAGVIDQVGTGVDGARVGERVWIYCGQWQRALGTAAEYIAIRADYAIALPDGVDLVSGACLGIPAVTAHYAVFADGPVTGQNVLVTGGAGAVGNYAIQLAKWGGAAKVIATVSSPEKAALAAKAGADHVINYREADVVAEVMAATDGDGVDRIVEVAFGVNLSTTVAVLKDNGVVATYASDNAPTPELPFYPMMMKNAQLRWVFMYKIPDAAVIQAFDDISTWLAAGPSEHLVGRIFPLDETAAAHEFLESGQSTGTVIIALAG